MGLLRRDKRCSQCAGYPVKSTEINTKEKENRIYKRGDIDSYMFYSIVVPRMATRRLLESSFSVVRAEFFRWDAALLQLTAAATLAAFRDLSGISSSTYLYLENVFFFFERQKNCIVMDGSCKLKHVYKVKKKKKKTPFGCS